MNAAEYRAAADAIVMKDQLTYGPISDSNFRKAEILAQLAIAAATSELAEAVNNARRA